VQAVKDGQKDNDYLETKEKANMLWTILVILLVLWLLGLVSGVTVGGFIHLLLVIALVIFVINLLTGRRTV
jgi:fatty-acid desaturase